MLNQIESLLKIIKVEILIMIKTFIQIPILKKLILRTRIVIEEEIKVTEKNLEKSTIWKLKKMPLGWI